ALEKLALGVLALAAIPLKTEKLGKGEVNVPVAMAGIEINPGDYLYADKSGVVVSASRLGEE
ncbi:MAG: RraA family protein, partial [bacterium]